MRRLSYNLTGFCKLISKARQMMVTYHYVPVSSVKEICPAVLIPRFLNFRVSGVESRKDPEGRWVLTRKLRDQRAVARYGGLTGSPDESGTKRRERELARAGNARVRHGMIQLAWRWLKFQNKSALARWYGARTLRGRASRRSQYQSLRFSPACASWDAFLGCRAQNGRP
jgi:hypothetical protein